MGDPRPNRIYSTLDGDPDLQDSIEQFVVTLAERVDALQDAHLAGDFEILGKLSGELRDDAQRLGYPQLADTGATLVDACLGGELEAVLDLLLELTEIARSVRRGHRGAF